MSEPSDSPELKTITDKKDVPSLEEAQEFIGGWITLLKLTDGILIVDEEGNLKGLPFNHEATKLVLKSFGGSVAFEIHTGGVAPIVGNAIYLPKKLNQRKWR